MACTKEKAAKKAAQDAVNAINSALTKAAAAGDYKEVQRLLKSQGPAQTALALAKLKLQGCEVRMAVARATRVP